MWDIISQWWQLITAAFGSFFAAVVGVAMRHAHKVQRGEPAPSWSRIWLDAPTLFFAVIAGTAVGQWLHGAYGMPELFGNVVTVIIAYLGPSVVDRALEWLEKRK